MGKILIACNNDSTTILHDFLESCADEAKQICADNSIEYSPVYPPNLSEQNVIGVMPEHQLCFFAGHGDTDGIYNEAEENAKWRYNSYKRLSKENWGAEVAE